MKTINVVAGVIKRDNKIFCCQRANKGNLALKWEFPGGKIEVDETAKEALIRELKEELDIISTVGKYIMTVNHQYDEFLLNMEVYYISAFDGIISLKEHNDSIWLKPDNLVQLDWAEADIPIIEELQKT